MSWLRISAVSCLFCFIISCTPEEPFTTLYWKGEPVEQAGLYLPYNIMNDQSLAIGKQTLPTQQMADGSFFVLASLQKGQNEVFVKDRVTSTSDKVYYELTDAYVQLRNEKWQFQVNLEDLDISVYEQIEGSYELLFSDKGNYGLGGPAMYNYEKVIPINALQKYPKTTVLTDGPLVKEIELLYEKVPFRNDTVGVSITLSLHTQADYMQIAIETLNNKRQSIMYSLGLPNRKGDTPIIQSSRGTMVLGYTFGFQSAAEKICALAIIAPIAQVERTYMQEPNFQAYLTNPVKNRVEYYIMAGSSDGQYRLEQETDWLPLCRKKADELGYILELK